MPGIVTPPRGIAGRSTDEGFMGRMAACRDPRRFSYMKELGMGNWRYALVCLNSGDTHFRPEDAPTFPFLGVFSGRFGVLLESQITLSQVNRTRWSRATL